MEPAYFSAFAALAGSTIGGLTSLTATWLSEHVQYRAQEATRDLTRRENLYKDFIDEASRLYADAFEHESTKVSNLVGLYALVSRMRVVSSPDIVESADRVVRVIITTYSLPNKTFAEMEELLENDAVNPLKEFSIACRRELALHRASRRAKASRWLRP
jgi:hypothetical protein